MILRDVDAEQLLTHQQNIAGADRGLDFDPYECAVGAAEIGEEDATTFLHDAAMPRTYCVPMMLAISQSAERESSLSGSTSSSS